MLQMKPRSPCAALCGNKEIASHVEKTRKEIEDSLRKNRYTTDLAGLFMVLSNSAEQTKTNKNQNHNNNKNTTQQNSHLQSQMQ